MEERRFRALAPKPCFERAHLQVRRNCWFAEPLYRLQERVSPTLLIEIELSRPRSVEIIEFVFDILFDVFLELLCTGISHLIQSTRELL